jgi:hypothetical protein
MHSHVKFFEKGLAVAANGAWAVFSRINKVCPNKSFTPRWSDRPLLKSWEKVNARAQTDLDGLTIPKTAREEKVRARSARTVLKSDLADRPPAVPAGYQSDMARLCRQHVLKEQPMVQIQGLRGARRK